MTKVEMMEELECVKMCAEEALRTACSKQNFHPFGHAYLWCVAKIGHKSFKFLVGCIDGRENLTIIEDEVKSKIKEIEYTWINLD